MILCQANKSFKNEREIKTFSGEPKLGESVPVHFHQEAEKKYSQKETQKLTKT